MLTCIACSKQLVDADDDGGGGAAGGGPGSNKPAVKSLTSQIKDVVLKLSGVYRPPPGRDVGPSSSYRSSRAQLHRSCYYDDGCYYPSAGTKSNGVDATHESWADRHPSAAAGGKVVDRSGAAFPVLLGGEEEEEPKEWVAQVEPGVHITFVSLPEGGNDLKRIRFSREMFNKWQAQRWWGENYDRVMELYNVQRFNRQALPTPPRSEDERDLSCSRIGSTRDSPVAASSAVHPYSNAIGSATTIANANNNHHHHHQVQGASTSRPTTASSTTAGGGAAAGPLGTPAPDPTDHFFPPHLLLLHQHQTAVLGGARPAAGVDAIASSVDAASRTTTSSRDDAASLSVSNASDMLEVTEWVEQDEPGVYITIRQMPDGARDLRRVRFSRERFGEVNAKLWWEENRDRIHAQYL